MMEKRRRPAWAVDGEERITYLTAACHVGGVAPGDGEKRPGFPSMTVTRSGEHKGFTPPVPTSDLRRRMEVAGLPADAVVLRPHAAEVER